MGKCKKDVTPLLKHWSYIFHALTHCAIVLQILFCEMVCGFIEIINLQTKTFKDACVIL